MILLDVNILVSAFRREAPDHDRYAAWLTEAARGSQELALHDATVTGFVRIVTNPRILRPPAPGSAAVAFIDRLVAAPRTRWLSGPPDSWTHLSDLLQRDRGLVGNLVPDAFLAALARTHRCRLATADRGFARFPGVDWFDPLAPEHEQGRTP
jgi:toxin-antitoxin system PIN domain toxin